MDAGWPSCEMTSFGFGLSARGQEGLVHSGHSSGILQTLIPRSSEATSPRSGSSEGLPLGSQTASSPCVLTWQKGGELCGVPFIRALTPLMGAPPPNTTALGVRISASESGGHIRSVATAALAQWARRGLRALQVEVLASPHGLRSFPDGEDPEAWVCWW